MPEFTSGLRPVQAVQGRNAKFEVEVDGQPPPTITWYKGARELTDGPHYEMTREGNRYEEHQSAGLPTSCVVFVLVFNAWDSGCFQVHPEHQGLLRRGR